MAKKPQQNKIGESFEQQLPDEFVPDFIWDNISNTLDSSKIPTESTEKIKTSFEEGFNEEAVPPLLWNGIQSTLEQANTPFNENNNKIKASFEAGHQDLLPEDLWDNVENQLEVEGVWRQVLKGLNKRTKARYWQEKGMQFGILALAILLLRGCDFGEWSNTTPIANESNTLAKVEDVKSQVPNSISVLNPNLDNASSSNNSTAKQNNVSKDNTLEQNYTSPSAPIFSTFSKTPSATHSETTTSIVATNNTTFANTPLLGGIKSTQQSSTSKEEQLANSSKTLDKASRVHKSNNKTTDSPSASSILANKTSNLSNKVNNNNNNNSLAATGIFNTKKNIVENALSSKIASPSNNLVEAVLNHPLNNEKSTSSKELFSQTALSTLIGQPFIDPNIDELNAFEIRNVANNKKKHSIRFELGMNGKVGTSLLLGNATNKAMETTSMVKTKTRVAGGIGIMFDCYLTANDAIVFGAYPLSSSQQYFGGYTNEGRYYHKEVKLAYFDFTLGYQRTLFHYNDFGTIPSSMYARLDYGLGYLSKSEEIINGLAAELGDSYNKLNHNIGLTIGNTHRINRFVIDYGIYGNIGLSSVLNVGPSGTASMEYNNLATMGGYLGLRYVL